MNNIARQTLRELVAKHGVGLSGDPKRCAGLLRDYCGSYRREINILVSALEERIGLDLLAANRQMPLGLLLTKLEKRLQENLAVTEDAARWAVDSWALALNVATDQEIAEREKQRAKVVAPISPPKTFEANSNPQPEQDNQSNHPQIQKQPPPKQPTAPFQPPIFKPRTGARPSNPFPNQPVNSSLQPRGNQAAQNATLNAPVVTNVNQPQSPSLIANARPKKSWWTIRGCFTGCFLLLLILTILIVSAPYALKVMRETQQSSQPARFPPR